MRRQVALVNEVRGLSLELEAIEESALFKKSLEPQGSRRAG
jgi:hypothetical protein